MSERHDIPEWYIPDGEHLLTDNDPQRDQFEKTGEIADVCPHCGEEYKKAEEGYYIHGYRPVDGEDWGEWEKRGQQLHGLSTIVKQYIRNLRPLLTSAEIDDSAYYWREVTLFDEWFVPPAGEVEWGLFTEEGISNTKLKQEYGLPPGFEPPEEKRFTVTGLEDILDVQHVELYWQFDKNQGKTVAKADPETLSIVRPLPKSVYERSVEYADEFLQEAGIGLEIGHQKKDDNDTDPF